MSAKKQKEQKSRPFPWPCSDCATRTVVPAEIDYTTKVKHDGVIHELHLPKIEVPRCETCGNRVVTTEVDERVNDALRSKLHLLTPELIRANIDKLGLTQQELAEWLDVAPETVSRWVTGTLIQSSRTNKRLRMFFAFPEAREMLRRLDEEPELGMVACLAGDEAPDLGESNAPNRSLVEDSQLGMEVCVPDKNSGHVNRIKSRYSNVEEHSANEARGYCFALFSRN